MTTQNTETDNLATLTSKATSMFEKMQRILEDREKPLVTGYKNDFYDIDRTTLGNIFSPNATYLWLLRQNGTNFGRIGIHTERMDDMEAALNCFGSGDPSQMELYCIKTNESGDARFQKVSFEKGRELTKKREYSCKGEALFSESAGKLAQVETKVRWENASQITDININTTHEPLDREQMVAITMMAYAMASPWSDTKIKTVSINGEVLDLPFIQIPEVVKDRFAPAPVTETNETICDIERQR